MGDCIFSIPTIKSIQSLNAPPFSKANLYLRPDVPDTIPPWAGIRPPVRMSKAEAESLVRLLVGQTGLGEVALFNRQAIDIDLDSFRKLGLDLSRGDIARYYSYAYRCQPALYKPWLEVEPSDRFKGAVLVNRTQRYHGRISYSFLAGRPNVYFVGYPQEYTAFCKDCPRLPHVQAEDALQLAQWLAGCKAFIGNQSFCFSLAEALKIPRLLEVYLPANNVMIHGPKGADAISQPLFQEWAEALLNT